MINKIKEIILNGWASIKAVLLLEWLNFKNWKNFTSIRAAYLIFAIIYIVSHVTKWKLILIVAPIYLISCAFFKWEPILSILHKVGFKKTNI